MFLVCARLLQWVVFFRHESSTFLSVSFLFVLCSVHFFNNLANLRSASKTKKKTKQNKQNLDNTLTISPKPPPPPHFFRHYATFCETFWIAPKGPPFICFDILKHNGCQKIPKGPPFYIFRHCDTVQKSHFKIFLGNFQSLKGPPFNFFHFLQPAGVSQSPKGPPFYIFDTVTLFNSFFFHILPPAGVSQNPFTILSLRYSADFGRSRLVASSHQCHC